MLAPTAERWRCDRECAELLKQAGGEHRNALVVNTLSGAGKRGEAWLSLYSATKFGVVGFTQSTGGRAAAASAQPWVLVPELIFTQGGGALGLD